LVYQLTVIWHWTILLEADKLVIRKMIDFFTHALFQHSHARCFFAVPFSNHLKCAWNFQTAVEVASALFLSVHAEVYVRRRRMISGAWSFTPAWIFIQPAERAAALWRSSFGPRFMAILCHARCSTCDINNENYVLRPMNKKRARPPPPYLFSTANTHDVCVLFASLRLGSSK
jgi:hypothetical protein